MRPTLRTTTRGRRDRGKYRKIHDKEGIEQTDWRDMFLHVFESVENSYGGKHIHTHKSRPATNTYSRYSHTVVMYDPRRIQPSCACPVRPLHTYLCVVDAKTRGLNIKRRASPATGASPDTLLFWPTVLASKSVSQLLLLLFSDVTLRVERVRRLLFILPFRRRRRRLPTCVVSPNDVCVWRKYAARLLRNAIIANVNMYIYLGAWGVFVTLQC